MSSPKHLIINCGASRITAASVSFSADNLVLEKFVTESLQYDYSDEDAWMGAVGDALRSLNNQHNFSGKASFIIPGNQVLTKTIRIPHVEASKRAQILAFEAQQNIPYPLHEVVWDSQVVGDDGVETEVLFIACKSNTIDNFCAEVSQAGFSVKTINAATILDYNAIQFATPDQEEDVLLINIGARSTNLLFKNADGFFVRNIQLGGNSLTQNIADSLGKTFVQAEDIKHKFFDGDLNYSEEDSGTKGMSACADSFMRRMSQEITRSIVNYRRQKNGVAPKRILLSGRGSLLSGLSEQLSTSQKIPVELFDSLKNVALGGGNDSESSATLSLEISEIIGAAAQDKVADGAGVNLLPEAMQNSMEFAIKKPFLMIAAVCFALAPWPAFIGYKQLSSEYITAAEAMKSVTRPLIERQSQIEKNAVQAVAVSQSIELVEGLKNSKTNWIQFLAQLQASLSSAEDAWLDALSVERDEPIDGVASYEVVLQGQMLVRETVGQGVVDQEVLSRRIKSLQSSFESSDFIVSSEPPVINWSSLRNGLNVLPFSINLVVDTSKPL
jgi:type IV pilus assembly protein PilM